MAKTVLVTGSSAGIGKATAIYLAQNGYNVYGAARRTEKMQDLNIRWNACYKWQGLIKKI